MTISALTWTEFFGGIFLLFLGGELLVRGAVAFAKKLGVSPLLIGATFVAFGTSAPELVVSIGAAARGVVDIAIGNVLGSNLANLLLILGVTAALRPIVVGPKVVRRDSITLLVSTAAVTGLAFADIIPRYAGAIMILLLVCHVGYGYWKERREATLKASDINDYLENRSSDINTKPLWVSSCFLIIGITGVIFGAHFLVESGTTMARAVGISEAVIGLTVVALGTSLPELATSVISAIKRHGDVALGNILGSSLFNLLGILGAVVLVHPAPIPDVIANLDIWVLLGITCLVLIPVLIGWRLGRVAGGILLFLYVLYIVHHFI